MYLWSLQLGFASWLFQSYICITNIFQPVACLCWKFSPCLNYDFASTTLACTLTWLSWIHLKYFHLNLLLFEWELLCLSHAILLYHFHFNLACITWTSVINVPLLDWTWARPFLCDVWSGCTSCCHLHAPFCICKSLAVHCCVHCVEPWKIHVVWHHTIAESSHMLVETLLIILVHYHLNSSCCTTHVLFWSCMCLCTCLFWLWVCWVRILYDV